jgi:hypothetical protein
VTSHLRKYTYIIYWVKRTESQKYKVLLKSSWTKSKKKCWLNLLNFGCHLLQNSLLGNIHRYPIIFSTLQKHCGSHLP